MTACNRIVSHQTINGCKANSLEDHLPNSISRFNYLSTVCDRAKEDCPIFPGGGKVLHWSFEDPAVAEGSEEEWMREFRLVRDEIGSRIAAWLKAVP